RILIGAFVLESDCASFSFSSPAETRQWRTESLAACEEWKAALPPRCNVAWRRDTAHLSRTAAPVPGWPEGFSRRGDYRKSAPRLCRRRRERIRRTSLARRNVSAGGVSPAGIPRFLFASPYRSRSLSLNGHAYFRGAEDSGLIFLPACVAFRCTQS